MRTLIFAVLMLVALPMARVDSAMTVDLHPFTRGSWKTLRDMHQGEPIIVHFWGISCGPCLAELPEWAAFKNKRPDLNLVLVDANPFPDDPDSVIEALIKDRLEFAENWIFTDSFEEKLRYEVDPHWHGEMPYTVLIGRDGSVSNFLGLANFAKLRDWLDVQKIRAQ
jgi:thiol-disulfide isomerase/thioredoxin